VSTRLETWNARHCGVGDVANEASRNYNLAVTLFLIFMSFLVFMECLAHKNFSGKFGEIRAKFLHTPKILPTSTPTVNSLFQAFKKIDQNSGIHMLN